MGNIFGGQQQREPGKALRENGASRHGRARSRAQTSSHAAQAPT